MGRHVLAPEKPSTRYSGRSTEELVSFASKCETAKARFATVPQNVRADLSDCIAAALAASFMFATVTIATAPAGIRALWAALGILAVIGIIHQSIKVIPAMRKAKKERQEVLEELRQRNIATNDL